LWEPSRCGSWHLLETESALRFVGLEFVGLGMESRIEDPEVSYAQWKIREFERYGWHSNHFLMIGLGVGAPLGLCSLRSKGESRGKTATLLDDALEAASNGRNEQRAVWKK